MSNIMIYRDYPIINGYIQIPPNKEIDKSRVDAWVAFDTIIGSDIVGLSLGSGPNAGSKFGGQRFLRLLPLRTDETHLSRYGYDPQQVLVAP